MKSHNRLRFLYLGIIAASMYCCKPEEIILHGDLSGLITDAETGQPLESVKVKLDPSNDSTITNSEGKYLFRNLTPGNYEVRSYKYSYITSAKIVTVTPEENIVLDFSLESIPVPILDKYYLDFGAEEIKLSFTISNISPKKLTYILEPSQSWINVSPSIGRITDDTDNIEVTLSRTGLPEKTYKETIKITSIYGYDFLEVPLRVYLNGVIDQDGNYYNIVKIGTQTWMAENLNVGIPISNMKLQTDNDTVEKYCYNGDCSVYGGYYTWEEAVQLYNPPDTGEFGPRQGICPVGWHIPTLSEWDALDNLYNSGGVGIGCILKETGFAHWKSPNLCATNETGFTALPGGFLSIHDFAFWAVGEWANWWSSKLIIKELWNNEWNFDGAGQLLTYDNGGTFINNYFYRNAISVRCIKDP